MAAGLMPVPAICDSLGRKSRSTEMLERLESTLVTKG